LMALASWIYHRVRVSRASAREVTGVLTRIDQRPRNAIAAIVATLVILLPTGVVAKANYDEYFIQHSSDLTSWLEMGGLQAIIGRSAIALELQGYTVRISPELAVDPAVIWAAGGEAISAYDPNVPVPLPVPSGGLALIIPATNADVFNFVERSYPSASVKALTPSFDRTQVEARAVLITPGDAERNLGATAVFGQGASATTVSHVVGAATWPVSSGAGTAASLQATLVLGGGQAWQPVSFRVAGLASGTLSIDGDSWPVNAAGTPSLRLGAGNHRVVVRGKGRAGRQLALQWTSPAGSIGLGGIPSGWTTVPPLFISSPSLPIGGLLGLYFPGPVFSGSPVLERVDQTVNTYYQNPPGALTFPFSTRWLGIIEAPVTGSYSFGLDSTGPSSLFVDGHEVLKTGPSGGAYSTAIMLTHGPHKLKLEYHATGSYLHCYFTWAPPGQSGLSPVPPSVTQPAHG
ncbi:MAG: hypothetical protein JWO59_935, partial [Chloroflexi bacterium]|nr:hypothetical protein [Chloroflexota bacterium]